MRTVLFLLLTSLSSFAYGQLELEANYGMHNATLLMVTSREGLSNRKLMERPNYHAGFVMSRYFSERASINLGLGYTIKGAKLDIDLVLPNSPRKGFDEGYILDYWQVPITVRYNFLDKRIRVQGELGGYAAFLRQAFHYYPVYDAWAEEYLEVVKKTDGFSKTDLGVMAGVGVSYELISNWRLGFRISSEWGLRNVMKKRDLWLGKNWSYGAGVFVAYRWGKTVSN